MTAREGLTEVADLPVLPERAADAHKGDFGRVLVIGGSPGLTGAACMAALAAQRAGAGLVTLALPESLGLVAAIKLTSAMSWPLPEDGAPLLGESAADAILAAADRFDVVALGPGLGRADETAAAACRLIAEMPLPVVVDADGLNALAGRVEIVRGAPAPRLLTPHPGEMARLTGLTVPQVQADRLGVSGQLAREQGALVALKGAGTIVTDGRRFFVNPSGNPGMATGGTGDVLTGMAAGLLCQGLDEFDALRLAVFLHGLAGDVAARWAGQVSMTAEDLLECVPEAFCLLAEAGPGAAPDDVLALLD